MPNFRYRALTENGDIVSGLITAPTSGEVARRIDYLRLVPVDPIVEESSTGTPRSISSLNRVFDPKTLRLSHSILRSCSRPARVSIAHSNCSQPTRISVACVQQPGLCDRASLRAKASEMLSPTTLALFSPMYVALVRVGEVSGTLDKILQVLANDRGRAEALRRKVADALRYPAFLLFAAICVLVFFLMFVLPQLGAVLHDFGAKIDPVAGCLSSTFRIHECSSRMASVWPRCSCWQARLLLARQATFRKALILRLVRLPLVRTIVALHQTAIFCRNLEVLLTAGVPLTTSLRIIANMMAAWGDDAAVDPRRGAGSAGRQVVRGAR